MRCEEADIMRSLLYSLSEINATMRSAEFHDELLALSPMKSTTPQSTPCSSEAQVAQAHVNRLCTIRLKAFCR